LKINEEKLKSSYHSQIDELELKLANLDLKHKQLQLEENRDSHSLKAFKNKKFSKYLVIFPYLHKYII
jgi:hypothetical protein